MPDTTPNFTLPYPSGTDDPCDFDEQWCDFTAAINAVLSNFQAGVDRAIPVIPVALLRSVGSVNVTSGQMIPFNEVTVDTAAMTDLDTDPYRISIKRTGRYSLGGYIEKSTGGVANVQLSLFIESDIPFTVDVAWSSLDIGASGNPYRLPAYGPVYTLLAGDRVHLQFNSGLLVAEPIIDAWLSVMWHADTEVP